jgi:putative transposase
MLRIAPSAKIREEIKRLLQDGVPEGGDVTGLLLRLGAQRLAQELLEEEATDFLGRDRYVRHHSTDLHRGHRNGYEPSRVRTAEGDVPLQVPQLRQTPTPYQSRLLSFLRGHTDVLKRQVAEMYARGLSTRDIEDSLRDVTGKRLISASGVSAVTERLWEEYQTFTRRDLSGFAVEYLFVDAIYESLRLQAGGAEGLLCAWGILADGRKVLLHLTLGSKESYRCWLGMLRDMVRRGLRPPISITSDGAPGLVRAIKEMWPKSLRLRCWVHRMRNVLDKVPAVARAEVKAHVAAIRDAPTYKEGCHTAQAVLARFERAYPTAMASLSGDLEASLAHLRLPVAHRKYVRTTNLIERSFLEERRRTKIIPRFFDERSCLKLVYATLVRASQRWQQIHFTDAERTELHRLRQGLGLRLHRELAPSTRTIVRRSKRRRAA